jgi:hypothetical protein
MSAGSRQPISCVSCAGQQRVMEAQQSLGRNHRQPVRRGSDGSSLRVSPSRLLLCRSCSHDRVFHPPRRFAFRRQRAAEYVVLQPAGDRAEHAARALSRNRVTFKSMFSLFRARRAAGRFQLLAEQSRRSDGRELFFVGADRRLMAVPVTTTPSFEHGVPTPLFATYLSAFANPFRTSYAVSRDGQQFLLNAAAENASTPSITVVSNWLELLKK